MNYLSLLVLVFQLLSASDLPASIESGWFVKNQEQRHFDYTVTYTDDGAEVMMPKVEGRSPIYSTQSIGDGQFLLLYETTSEDGTVTNRYDLLDVKKKTLQFLSESSSQTSGTYGLGMYVKAAELLIQTYAFESIESVNEKGEVKAIAGQHGWSAQSPDGRFLAVQSGFDSDVKTTIYDLVEGTSVDCPLVPKIDYVFSPLALTFSPDSRYFFSMPKVWGDRINIFESVTGKLVDSVVVKGATLSSPGWSSDGKLLNYLVQTDDEEELQVDTPNLAILFGNHFGIYNIVKKENTLINFPEERLIYSARISQADDAVFLKSVTKTSCLQWVKDGEMPRVQPVNLDIYSIKRQSFQAVVHDVLEGIQENYWMNAEGLSYQHDIALFYRNISPTVFEIVRCNVNTGQLNVIKKYSESVQIYKSKQWLYVLSSSGLERISLEDDYSVEQVSKAQGVLTPQQDAFLHETTDGNKMILHIQLIE